ncbi:hypothetical protein FNYG_05337 [Fusarium nygamai]|uniref:Uncharacterized protein n=1 Tax=Gibberella nygamai TaxID=42673 RepID=A0A2K0WGB6_GIBNY|nr:hypothetical protein FNYG_05337 [Fusarium nygamai]
MDQWGMKVDNGDSNLQQTKPKVSSESNLKSQDSPIFFLQEPPPRPWESAHKSLERIMDLLKQNKTTANEAIKLEDAKNHPLRKDKQHSARYFKLLEARRQLPVSSMR